MRALLEALGRPDRRTGAVLHIGGTNGKGSTAAFAAALLAAGGDRVGVFTSPHLLRLGERFRVDGAEARRGDLVRLGSRVLEVGAELGATFFELVTAMALELFAEARVTATVLEVGLGGRFDATNAVDADVALVTGVDFDHQEYLGDTIEAIAGEKAGIFKAGRPAVIGRAGRAEAVPMLLEGAARAGATPVLMADPARVAGMTLGLAGGYQAANAACAVEAVGLLRSGRGRGPLVEECVRRALAETRCPGRLERIADAPNLWVDGAHNPGGATAMVQALLEAEGENATIVLAVSKGKDAGGIARAFAPIAGQVLCTEAPSDRAISAADLADQVRRALPRAVVTAAPSPGRAIEAAREAGRYAVVAGSLFLVGEARRIILGEVADPVVLTDPVSAKR